MFVVVLNVFVRSVRTHAHVLVYKRYSILLLSYLHQSNELILTNCFVVYLFIDNKAGPKPNTDLKNKFQNSADNREERNNKRNREDRPFNGPSEGNNRSVFLY